MRIKKYTCTQFGGLKNQTIELEEGLNIILGANEAGKSTMVEGIYSTLFKQPKLNKATKVDKEFIHRFTPRPSGDFMDGKLEFTVENDNYKLTKTWGSQAEALMELSDGVKLRKDEAIEEKLKALLRFGERTYGNIIFSKQQDLKRAIEIILSDKETTDNLSTILRKIVMELDGISVDKLRARLEQEEKDLCRRWDVKNNRPENLGTTYKAGVGKILEKHYQIVDIERKIRESKEIEDRYISLGKSLKEIHDKQKNVKDQIDKYSNIEQEVNKRAALEPKVSHLREKAERQQQIIRTWPAQEEKLKAIEVALQQRIEEISNLETEMGFINKLKEKSRLVNQLNKIEKNLQEITELQEKITHTPPTTKEQINILSELTKKILTIETAIKAGTMKGKVLSKTKDVFITKDFDDKIPMDENVQFTANGYIKIEVGENLAIEIQSGEFDYNHLKEELNTAQKDLNNLLTQLQVKSLEDAKHNLDILERSKNALNALENANESLLEEYSYEQLKLKIAELDQIKISKEPEELQKEIVRLRGEETQLKAEKISIEKDLSTWVAEFKDFDTLMEKVLDVKGEIREQEKLLESLQPLPGEFKTADEFSKNLQQLRSAYDQYQNQLDTTRDQYYELSANLPETSTEEMLQERRNLEQEFQRLSKKGQSLLKIKEVFEKKLEEMDKNSFEPLEKSFCKYLKLLTLDNYDVASMDESLNPNLIKGNTQIPVDLLSTGTKDCVALALRFAIIEVLYENSSGIIVLDDCLVDLDPQRKAQAISLIKQFAQNNQVIFTTCNPQTAMELGGRVINI